MLGHRRAYVTIIPTDAWETWIVDIPDDVSDENLLAFVKEHFGLLEKWLKDSGSSECSVEEVEWIDD